MGASNGPLTVGAWLPADWHRPLIADERKLIEDSTIDLLLVPENHDTWANRGSWKRTADELDTAIYAGFEDDGWRRGLFYDPETGREHVYTKHTTTTADRIALENDTWSPEDYLHTLELAGVTLGTTICHDHYLSPFMRYEVLNDADVLVNLSGRPVVRHKWGEVLQARAIENGAFTVCTMHGLDSDGSETTMNRGHVFAFDPFGDPLPLRDLETGSTVVQFETEPDNIYSFEVRSSRVNRARRTRTEQYGRKSIDRIRANVFGSARPTDTTLDTQVVDGRIHIAYRDEETAVDVGASHTLQLGDEAFAIVSLEAEEAFEPERLYELLLSIPGIEDRRILLCNHWEQLAETYIEDVLEPVLRARCVEWCSPILLTSHDRTRAYQLANKHKDTHRLPTDEEGRFNFETRRAFGVESALKPVNGSSNRMLTVAKECSAIASNDG